MPIRVFDSGNDEDPWNVLVSTTYTNAAGYAGIAEEFEKIRREHQTLAVDGKSLKELGAVVASVTVYENPAELGGTLERAGTAPDVQTRQ